MDWQPLSKTDYIRVVWPSAAPSLDEAVSLQQFMEQLDAVVKDYGLAGIQYNVDEVNPSASFTGYYANSDSNRANTLRQALMDPSVKAIWTGRGGYGAAEVIQIFEQSGFKLPSNRVIPLIGFSDFTSFHLLASHYKWPSIHGPVANFNFEMSELTANTDNNKTSVKPLIDILKGDIQEVTYRLEILNAAVLKELPYKTPINTKIVGSNFSIVQRNDGTATQLGADNSILFFEDTPEDIHRLRSLLVGVARTGILDSVIALFFGSLPVSGGSLQEVLSDFSTLLQEVRGINKPILLNPSFGHGPINQVLPLGTKTTLEFLTDGSATIKVSTNQSGYDLTT